MDLSVQMELFDDALNSPAIAPHVLEKVRGLAPDLTSDRSKKTCRIEIRLTVEEKQRFQALCNAGNMTMSDWLRSVIDKREVTYPVPLINRETYRELHQIGQKISALLESINARSFSIEASKLNELDIVWGELNLVLLEIQLQIARRSLSKAFRTLKDLGTDQYPDLGVDSGVDPGEN